MDRMSWIGGRPRTERRTDRRWPGRRIIEPACVRDRAFGCFGTVFMVAHVRMQVGHFRIEVVPFDLTLRRAPAVERLPQSGRTYALQPTPLCKRFRFFAFQVSGSLPLNSAFRFAFALVFIVASVGRAKFSGVGVGGTASGSVTNR